MRHCLFKKLFFLIALICFAGPLQTFAAGILNEGFILNKGQWPEHVLARASFPFGDVILQKDGILFYLQDKTSFHVHGHEQTSLPDSTTVRRTHVYKMNFRKAQFLSPQGFEASAFHVNYMKGNDPSQWASKLFCYKKIVVQDVYPSIDLVLYVTSNGIKYDLNVRANADPKQIVIDYEGTDGLSIDKEGNLQIKTSLGTVTEKMPIAFIEKNGPAKEPVLCRYQLSDSTVRFNIKNLTRAKEEQLVIDPQLIFATYSGSYADNWGNTATYDEDGSLYAAGIAFENGFPVTPGAFQQAYHGYNNPLYYNDPDVAIMKYDATGALVYATYLGGKYTEIPTSTIVNKNNELFILGTTSSSGASGYAFPTTAGAYDNTFNGGSLIYPLGYDEGIEYVYGSDLFVTKLNADGTNILASTFIGGSGNDGLMLDTETLSRNYGDQLRSEILLDTLGDVYIASHTQSSNILNPSRPGYDLTYHGGGRDGIIMKLKGDLSDIVWNTYWGGSGLDACYSLQFGTNNDLFITGGTTSSNLPATGIHQTSNGSIDGFILHLSNDGTTALHSTYLGTSSIDQSYLVQTDATGDVYVLGQTQGTYPIENAAYSNGRARQFIHKLNPSLDTTLFSTTIGSGEAKTDFVPTAFLVNDCGNIFVCGWGGVVNDPFFWSVQNGRYYQSGNTKDLPLTANAFQKHTDSSDFYLMVLKKDAEKLLYATYFGGNGEREHVDGGTSRFDKRGIVYESVCGGCGGTSLFPVTPGAHSATNNSYNCNNAVFKFDLSSLVAAFIADTTKLCGKGPVTFTNKSLGGASYIWDLGDGSSSTSSGSFTHTYQQAGTYDVQLIAIDETTCIGRDTAEKTIQVYEPPLPKFAHDTAIICKGDTAQLNADYNSDYTYLWTPNLYLSDNTVNNPLAYPPDSRYYTVQVKDTLTQCEARDSVWVMVVQALADTRYQNTTGCQGQPSILVKNYSDKDGFTYLWDFGDGSISQGGREISHSYGEFGDYTVTVVVSNLSCSITDTVKVHLPPVKIPNLFTPNDDHHNDTYVIEGMTDNWKLDVYNRWGNLVYTRQPYDQSWAGDGLNGGIYYFLITDPAGNKCKGWVHVLK